MTNWHIKIYIQKKKRPTRPLLLCNSIVAIHFKRVSDFYCMKISLSRIWLSTFVQKIIFYNIAVPSNNQLYETYLKNGNRTLRLYYCIMKCGTFVNFSQTVQHLSRNLQALASPHWDCYSATRPAILLETPRITFEWLDKVYTYNVSLTLLPSSGCHIVTFLAVSTLIELLLRDHPTRIGLKEGNYGWKSQS